MEVPHRQKLSGLLLKPLGLGQGLALGAVAVTTGVISRAFKAATVASIEMSSQLLSATDLNGPHDFFVRGGQALRLSVALPVLAKNIGQLGARLFLSCRPLPRSEKQHREDTF